MSEIKMVWVFEAGDIKSKQKLTQCLGQETTVLITNYQVFQKNVH